MPKQIKTKELPAGEKTNCKLGIAVMLAAFAFGGTLMALVSVLEKGGTAGTALGIAVAVFLVTFFAFSLWHCIQGFITYEKQENYGVLMTAVLTAFSAFSCILNVQLALTMLLSSLGMDDAAKDVIGGRSFNEFMATQRTPWIMMIAGVTSAVVAGLIALRKFAQTMQQ